MLESLKLERLPSLVLQENKSYLSDLLHDFLASRDSSHNTSQSGRPFDDGGWIHYFRLVKRWCDMGGSNVRRLL